MNRDQVKQLLPILAAFAHGQPVQFRDKRYTEDWVTINPDTTCFQIVDLDPREWRLPPDTEGNDTAVPLGFEEVQRG